MAIDKRKNKDGSCSYRVRIILNGEVRDQQTFRGKDASDRASKWETKRQYEIDNLEDFPDSLKVLTVDDLYNKWLKEHAKAKKAASSIVRDQQLYRDYIKDYIGNKNAHKVTPEELERIKQDLTDEDRLSHKSINNTLQLIKTVFNFGVKRRHLLFNPMSSVSMLSVDLQDYNYWNVDDVIKFLQYTSNKYIEDRVIYVLYLVCLKTGLRIGEAIALKWDCIDFNNKIITVRRTFDTANQNIKDTTKGKKSRSVGICDELYPELLALWNARSNSDFVFPNRKGNFIDYNNIRERNFEKDIKAAGVKMIRIHDMRHTYASHFIMMGGDIFTLKEILGHSDIKTTMKYAHLAPNQKAQAANVINYGLNKVNNVVSFNSTVQKLSMSDFSEEGDRPETLTGPW